VELTTTAEGLGTVEAGSMSPISLQPRREAADSIAFESVGRADGTSGGRPAEARDHQGQDCSDGVRIASCEDSSAWRAGGGVNPRKAVLVHAVADAVCCVTN
jgi:hypothetical protein